MEAVAAFNLDPALFDAGRPFARPASADVVFDPASRAIDWLRDRSFGSHTDVWRKVVAAMERVAANADVLERAFSGQVDALSHNDLAGGNILTGADGKVALLDFESVGVTPAGFDLGSLLLFVLRSRLASGLPAMSAALRGAPSRRTAGTSREPRA